MVSHELMGPWGHCILQCIPTCHGILGIPDPEMCTCGILGTLGSGTLRTLDPEIYTCQLSWDLGNPGSWNVYLTWDLGNLGS